MPQQKVAPNDIKNRWPHLKDIPFETSNKEISVLIGPDLPQLHINYDVRVGENDHPVGMLTKLGWVLLGGKADKGKANVTLNHVKTDGLQKLVQKFWEIKLCNIAQKRHEVASKKGCPCNENTANYHIESPK